MDAALRAYGRIDSIVNNAGATKHGDFFELSEADWTDGFALKFFSSVRLSRARMAASEKKPRLGAEHYRHRRTHARSELHHRRIGERRVPFVHKGLAEIGIRDGVQVNAINPGWVRTDRLRHLLEKEAAEHGGRLRGCRGGSCAAKRISCAWASRRMSRISPLSSSRLNRGCCRER